MALLLIDFENLCVQEVPSACQVYVEGAAQVSLQSCNLINIITSDHNILNIYYDPAHFLTLYYITKCV